MSDLPLTLMLIGGPKQGKTWLSATAPKPLLIIDLEGRSRYSPQGEKAVFWNGTDDPMQIKPRSESQTYILQTTEVQKIDTALQWLRAGKHPFKSIVLDSVMELRTVIKEDIFPRAIEIPRKEWGKVNGTFEQTLRDIKGLVDKPGSPAKCVVFITGATRDIETEKVKPLIRGTVGELAIYWMDTVGYLAVDNKDKQRYLYLGPNPDGAEVGDGTNRIVKSMGTKILNPDLDKMFAALQNGNNGSGN